MMTIQFAKLIFKPIRDLENNDVIINIEEYNT